MNMSIIEHIVLFKVKPDTDSSKISYMIDNLNALISLDQVQHISAGALHRTTSSSLTFTHMLHSRYKSKDDLSAYSAHPAHVSVVTESVKPIVDDVMAVDWIAGDLDRPAVVPAGSAMRVTFLKIKQGLREEESDKLVEVIGGSKDEVSAIDQISFGKNFSPERAKGYSIASLAVFRDLSELEANSEIVNCEEKVRDLVEDVLVLDYVIQPQQQ